VRVLADRFADYGHYGSATGILVGRCDVLLTARHVAEGPNDAQTKALQVYSPQIRGKVVDVEPSPAARALWPKRAKGAAKGNFDADLAVLKLSQCPTHTSLPLERLRPLQFADLRRLKTVGYPCDSRQQRGPEHVAMRGQHIKARGTLGVSRSIRLTPGARPGQSGSPIYTIDGLNPPSLSMILVATARDTATPLGCAQDPDTGQSEAGTAAYGVVLREAFIEGLRRYIRALNAQ